MGVLTHLPRLLLFISLFRSIEGHGPHTWFRDLVMHPDNIQLILEMAERADMNFGDLFEEAKREKKPPRMVLKNQAVMDSMDEDSKFKKECKTMDVPTCDPNAKYRTADGSCNNLKNPTWGMAMTPQPRLLDPAYDDGFDIPRMISTKNYKKLPNAREISNVVHKGPQDLEDSKLSQWVMQWGQFLDHDVVLTPLTQGRMAEGKLECCNGDGCLSECFPIMIPPDDPHFNRTCMNFIRSAPAMDRFECKHGPRQQINAITSAIDGSNVYGSSQDMQNKLRSFIGGRLKTGDPDNSRLPVNPNLDACQKDVPSDRCQLAGDARANVIPGLGTIHTICHLYHNKVAKDLVAQTGWDDDEKIFQEAKKIVSAVLQHITYGEYLPVVLGDKYMNDYGLTIGTSGFQDTYDPSVNIATVNSFGAASFRFGHSQAGNVQGNYKKNFQEKEMRDIQDTYHRPNMILQTGALGGISRWLAVAPSMKADRILDKGVRELLFPSPEGMTLDLAALNIQRGRDHGLPPYNEFRELCELPKATHFQTSEGGLVDHTDNAASKLEEIYTDVDDIDLFAGGLSEKHVDGGSVGPTFACLLAKQFKRYKDGDRFYYERGDPVTGFTAEQLTEIRKVTLARVICDVTDSNKMYKQVMLVPGGSNQKKQCTSNKIPSMSLAPWASGLPI